MYLKISAATLWPSSLGHNVLNSERLNYSDFKPETQSRPTQLQIGVLPWLTALSSGRFHNMVIIIKHIKTTHCTYTYKTIDNEWYSQPRTSFIWTFLAPLQCNRNKPFLCCSISGHHISKYRIRLHINSCPYKTVTNYVDLPPLSKHWLPNEYHVHIWQVSSQPSCGDTCQIWKGFKWSN